jgi:RNA polymerase sigma-70 factor (ECF subfamily)
MGTDSLSNVDFVKLVMQAKRGSRNAFTRICELKQRKIFFYCLNVLGNSYDAEDALQEAILQMWKSINALKNPESFDAWMTQVARSKCLYIMKKRNRSEEMLLFADASGDTPEVGVDTEDLDEEVIPEKYAENSEMSQTLYKAILELPLKRREALIMYYYEGLSTTEIAKITGSTQNVVTGVITKARHQLKEILTAMEGMLVMGIMPEHSVIGRVLNEQATLQITDNDLQKFEGVWQVAVASVTPYVALMKNYAKALGGGAAAVACVFTGIAISANTDMDAPENASNGKTAQNLTAPVPEEPEQIETIPVSEDGSIIFSGDCDCGHLNPRSAELADNPADETNVAWRIMNKDSGAEVSSGSGKDASASVASLAGAYGAYTLTYTVKGSGESYVEFSRDFAIGDKADAAKEI